MSRRTRLRSTPKRSLLAGVALLLVTGLLSSGPAGAHTFKKSDGDDSLGRLDIRTASVGHGNNKVVHTVRTFEGWSPKSLGKDSFFIVEIDKNFDDDFEQCAFIFFAGGRLRGSLTNCRRTFIRPLPVSKPSKASAQITIPTANTGGAYRWVVFSFWSGLPARCSDVCFDAAPNRPPPILHDLIPPSVAMDIDPLRVWETHTEADFFFPFTVSDSGGAGVKTWTVQLQSIGSGSWTNVATGKSGGAQTPLIDGTEGTRLDYRVFVSDKQGNNTADPVRRVYIPTDDDTLDPADFSAPPTPIGNFDAFGGTYSLMLMSAVWTYEFSPGDDCTFEVIGTGFGDWQVRVTPTGGSPQDLTDDQFPSTSRVTIYSDSTCASGYQLSVVSGSFGLDAVLG